MHLTAAEWSRIETLFPLAAELGGAERERFLERECAHEPRVRGELEAMLAAAGTEDRLLDAQVALSSTEPARPPEVLPPGARLGSWKIRSPIGTGGMGEVYLAERADGAYAMSAAIKLLKRELFSYTNAQRFLRERRVLARLSHPNIARVLDAGTTDDGRPFLVMEYVHGARITDHARSRALSPRAAARLMLAVADAVAEAHRRGIVHRDLKPANVMVNDEQEIKLLDFGIAKLLDEPEPAKGEAVPLTPAYAAPEQILGGALTPATDVYALGVMLFQLLTHRLPHAREGLPLPVIAAGLRDEAIERPSHVVLHADGLLPPAERGRQAQAVAGDLDWIALKALQAEPARRYPSAAEFADDLRRYLEHLPVLARQDSLSYRASRFVRRYPTQVLATAAAFLALGTALALALWEARTARAETLDELAAAVHRLAPGQQVRFAQVLVDLGGMERQAAGLLEQSIPALRAAGDQPATLGQALLLRGRLLLSGGDRNAAREALTQAVGLLEASPDADAGQLAQARRLLRQAT